MLIGWSPPAAPMSTCPPPEPPSANTTASTRSPSKQPRTKIGDRATLGHDIRRLYLNDATGTVTGWAGQLVVAQLHAPTGHIRCPPRGLGSLGPEKLPPA